MSTFSTYLSSNIEKELRSIFEKPYAGLQSSAEIFLILHKKALREVRGIFTEPEIKAIIDIRNATMLDAQIYSMTGTLVANIEDANSMDGLGAKWGIDIDNLIAKIRKLNDYQVFFLSFECWSFWYGANNGKNLDQFIKRFL